MLYVINGRFGTQRLTGVQRVAMGLLQALDALDGLPGAWQLLSPPGVAWPALQRVRLRTRRSLLGTGHGWEQSVMAAAAARGARVLNVAGSGPWFGGPQVSWLHDAAVFDHPEAYRATFVHWYRALFRHRARRGDLLITPSEHAQGRLAHHLRVPVSRILVLPHGGDHFDAVQADTGVLDRLGVVPGCFWLCIASPNPNKNLPRLLRAHARAEVGHLPLVRVGAPNARVFSHHGPAAPARGLIELPQASDQELKALVQAARALLMPSLYEGYGLPALEAMRLGCPVVAGRAGALPEVCGDAAYYVDPSSEDDMVAALEALAIDDSRIAQLRSAGAARSAPQTWSRAARRLLELLGQRAGA